MCSTAIVKASDPVYSIKLTKDDVPWAKLKYQTNTDMKLQIIVNM